MMESVVVDGIEALELDPFRGELHDRGMSGGADEPTRRGGERERAEVGGQYGFH